MTKKVFYLALTLIVLSAASVNAQVRIGGTNDPDPSAVLDLNPNTGDANGGLALPRVALTSETQQLNGADPQPGTVVYNTSSALDGEGTYVWTKVDGGSSVTFSGISTTADTGIAISGNGTNASPLVVGIANKGVTTGKIADDAVTSAKIADGAIVADDLADGAVNGVKLNAMGAATNNVLCYNGKAWEPKSVTAAIQAEGSIIKSIQRIVEPIGSDKESVTVNFNPVNINKTFFILNSIGNPAGGVRIASVTETSATIQCANGAGHVDFSLQVVEFY
jgi:hypothetical protein